MRRDNSGELLIIATLLLVLTLVLQIQISNLEARVKKLEAATAEATP